MRAYYNENDAGAAAWLRELIRAGLIADGDVDERSIADVQPSDIRGYQRVHLFAGIAGWDYALQLADWPDDRPVWSGSCPCQPFSSAGKQEGHGDARNLWPEMLRLVSECRPDTIFGEQVASAIGHGWIDGVCTDLEAEGYACGQIVLPACSVGAPHIRQRLWYVADSQRQRRQGRAWSTIAGSAEGKRTSSVAVDNDGTACVVADRHGERRERERLPILKRGSRQNRVEASRCGETGIVAITEIVRASGTPEARHSDLERNGGTCSTTNRSAKGWDQQSRDSSRARNSTGLCSGQTQSRGMDQPALIGDRTPADAGSDRESEVEGRIGIAGGSGSSGFWSDYTLIPCRDGKARRAKPGIFPLAARLPGRVVALRGAGNSINPWCAAEFIRAYLESEGR